ncbi:MAG: HU family DNA-binding protein [Brevinematales bacterium]|jgi:DNA-binding protein HU-beta|nr:HU family DNA-binding protein [Brevinematales bacterium]
MTKTDFIDLLAAKTGETKKRAGELVDTFLSIIESSLAKGETVQFVGWGTFEVQKKAEKMGRNPKTGAPIKIPAKKVVKFKVGKKLAEKVKK